MIWLACEHASHMPCIMGCVRNSPELQATDLMPSFADGALFLIVRLILFLVRVLQAALGLSLAVMDDALAIATLIAVW